MVVVEGYGGREGEGVDAEVVWLRVVVALLMVKTMMMVAMLMVKMGVALSCLSYLTDGEDSHLAWWHGEEDGCMVAW